MSLLAVVASYLHLLYQARTSLITLFFGFMLIIQLVLQRKNDLEYLKKLQE
jgi:hypothetical protein